MTTKMTLFASVLLFGLLLGVAAPAHARSSGDTRGGGGSKRKAEPVTMRDHVKLLLKDKVVRALMTKLRLEGKDDWSEIGFFGGKRVVLTQRGPRVFENERLHKLGGEFDRPSLVTPVILSNFKLKALDLLNGGTGTDTRGWQSLK